MVVRVVHLEDNANDRELVAEMLRAEGIDCEIIPVAVQSDFERALETHPDVILSDYSIPGFGGDAAQDLARTRCPHVPFVFVSGSIGEERAVERLKGGATDYVLKDRLDKLGPSVKRALREAEERRRRAAAESDLRRLNAELEGRIEQRTRELLLANDALDRARGDAERANLAKSQFLSRMSHELRTPLNAIIGFSQLLELEPLTTAQMEGVGHIRRGGEHLLNLINEVLDISRIEAGHLTLSPEPVSLGEVAEHAVELIRPLAAHRGVSVTLATSPDAVALADRQRVNQILLNLLSNAIKYNRPNGSVTVTTSKGGGHVRLSVADTGAGIPAEKLGLLFTPFERLGAEQSSIEGTGLGLALSKRLAEAMGGTLSVESEVDRGTTCWLELPVATQAEVRAETPTVASLAPANYPGTIVYVEDNISNVVLMERLLTRRPAVVLLHAPDGRTALDIVRSHRPDLVILDLHLPDMSGEEVLRRLWEDPSTRRIPVAVLSADAMRQSQRQLLAAGAIAYLTKPFNIAEVLRLIDGVLVHAD